MLSSLLRPSRRSRRQANDRSPFNSPSPEAARQNPLNERTHLLRQNQNNAVMGVETSGAEGDDHADSNLEDEEVESDNEDGVRDETPLLPIFSAAHLGLKVSCRVPSHCSCTDANNRCPAHIQFDSCHTSPRRVQMRNNIVLGPASFPTGVTISSQADPTRNSRCIFFESNRICPHGQLLTVQ